MYTPGDNEWTDCDRVAGYDSEDQLKFIRANFFDTQTSHGKRRMRLDVQSAPYVENRRWHVGGVTYATLHVVGSDNNLGDVAPDPVEWAARDAATNAWLELTFDAAAQRRSAAVMLIVQGGFGFDSSDTTRAGARDPRTLLPQDGYYNFLKKLRAETIEYRKPVVVVHGDSHYFRVDKPLQDATGDRIENFTRVETPGDNAQSSSNDVQWISVRVDPRDEEVFSFQQEIVPGNLTTYEP